MLTDEARLEAFAKYKEFEQQITNETAEHNINVNLRETEAFDNYVTAVQDGLSGIGQILGSVADAWETSIKAQVKGDNGSGSSVRYAEVTPTQTDYTPQGITNVTGEQETQNLSNAMAKAPIWVSVKDIDAAQSKVKTRDKEATF